jgi:predicted aldo/keto reductase-like oxidoreductase
MTIKKTSWSRRQFLKAASTAGAASILASVQQTSNASDTPKTVPMRSFGNTGVNVPILSFGGSLNTSINLLMLRQAVKWGVTYWDTAASYMGGNSEKAFGKYLAKYPQDRPKIFLVTKSHAWTLNGMTKDLNRSLERLKTDYIDLFFVHGVGNIKEMNSDTKAWAQKAKKAGKIRFIGFSTHRNMASCLFGAAQLGWIDGIMMTYNYRLMHEDDMQKAVDACVRAGIGLTAMKTQGGGQFKTNSEAELELGGRFLEAGFTDAQAKLMAVWQNPHIASICSEMPNMTILLANVAAALNKTQLSKTDKWLLKRYARETRSDYCSGCGEICESQVEGNVPIGDVMRCLMYDRSYGDRSRAIAQFRTIPAEIRRQISATDYSPAEKKCPRKMAIGRLMREAVFELS